MYILYLSLPKEHHTLTFYSLSVSRANCLERVDIFQMKRLRGDETFSSAEQMDIEFAKASISGTPCVPPQALPVQTIIQEVNVWAQVPATKGSKTVQPYPLSLIMMLSRGPDALSVNSLFESGFRRNFVNATQDPDNCDVGFLSYLFSYFQFNRNCYIPLAGRSSQVSLNPPLSAAFQSGRAAGTNVQIKSDAISGTRMNIAGSFNAGYVNDIRGAPGLEPTKIASYSNVKERHLNLSTMDGIRFIEGIAVDPQFQNPSANSNIEEGDMQWENLGDSTTGSYYWSVLCGTGTGTDFDDNTTSTIQDVIWISPWAQLQPSTVTTVVQNVTAPSVCMYDEPTIRFQYNVTNELTGTAPNQASWKIVHMWCYCEYDDNGDRSLKIISSPGGYDTEAIDCNNGNIGPSTAWVYPNIYNSAATRSVNSSNNNTAIGISTVTSRAVRPGFANTGTDTQVTLNGLLGPVSATRAVPLCPITADINQVQLMYFGTLIVPCLDGVSLTATPAAPATLNVTRIDFCGCPGFAVDRYAAWTLDWRNLPSGQNVNINGTIQVQANPSSATLPLLKKYGEHSALEPSCNSMWTLLSLYYNSDSIKEFRHIYKEADYQEMLQRVVSMSPVELLSLANNLEEAQLKLFAVRNAAQILQTWGGFSKFLHGIGSIGKDIISGIGQAVDVGEKVLPFVAPLLGESRAAQVQKLLPMARKAANIGGQLIQHLPGGASAAEEGAEHALGTRGHYGRNRYTCTGDYTDIYTVNDFKTGGAFCQVPRSTQLPTSTSAMPFSLSFSQIFTGLRKSFHLDLSRVPQPGGSCLPPPLNVHLSAGARFTTKPTTWFQTFLTLSPKTVRSSSFREDSTGKPPLSTPAK